MVCFTRTQRSFQEPGVDDPCLGVLSSSRTAGRSMRPFYPRHRSQQTSVVLDRETPSEATNGSTFRSFGRTDPNPVTKGLRHPGLSRRMDLTLGTHLDRRVSCTTPGWPFLSTNSVHSPLSRHGTTPERRQDLHTGTGRGNGETEQKETFDFRNLM